MFRTPGQKQAMHGFGRTNRAAEIAGLMLAAVSVNANAQTVQGGLPVTDGPINAFATSGDTLCLGGNFGDVGPNTGPAALPNATTLRFTLTVDAKAELALFDLQGRRVRTLMASQPRGAGACDVRLDRAGLASAVCMVRLRAAGATATRRIGIA